MARPVQDGLKEIEPSKTQEITHSLNELYQLGKPQTDEETEDRVNKYFQLCEYSSLRPGVESLCAALHISRTTLFRWANGEDCSPRKQEIIAAAKSFIVAFLEQSSLQGQVSPPVGIFLLKNWANYKDAISIEETVNQTQDGRNNFNVADLPKLGEQRTAQLPVIDANAEDGN